MLARLGLGWDACRAVNPRLIYVSLPGYAEADADVPLRAWDSVIMAETGVFRDMGLNRALLGVRASFSSLPMPSVYASIFAAYAAVCAVLNGDVGEHVEVPLASALSEALVHNTLRAPLDDRYRSRRALRLAAGKYPVTPAALRRFRTHSSASTSAPTGVPSTWCAQRTDVTRSVRSRSSGCSSASRRTLRACARTTRDTASGSARDASATSRRAPCVRF